MKTMELDTRSLWQKRFERYLKESIGYWQYAARSSFLGFVLFLVILSSYYYAKILQELPTDYPFIWIVLLILVPALSSSPIRTLLRSADRMFLLRTEHRMSTYFRSAFLYSFVVQAFWTFIAWVALWPLYHHCVGRAEQPVFLMLGFIMLVKLANLLASWQETRLADHRARLTSIIFRWLATLTVVYFQYIYNLLWACGLALALIFLWLAAAHFVSRHVIGWDYLIAKEKHQQARLYSFFNWFVDVPHLPTRITRRRWISGVTRWIPFQQDATYMYLYTKTLLRTELFAILLRVTFVGTLAIVVSSSDVVRAVILCVVLLISIVQLTTLERAHRYTFWLETYPLNRSTKAGSLAFLIWCVLLIQTCVLTIPLLIRSSLTYVLVPLLAVTLISFICGVVLRRRFQAAILRET
ncbi:ABC transporter permease [Paenibacillus sp. SYP-B3998]|uniref:ABC transporter permease n=1 Tax=Paenibacillus sp. SYP-B3998 TaxID=2678564 RepID=A0A6G4A7K7_9BACL|nr:ABC transporter permease [Paenibacillus sp. SYP-B3998]NEW09607.1 ABC transporter permease [Paenibacillus sp. SYP-B3998]